MAALSGGSDNDDMPNTSLRHGPSASVSPSAESAVAAAPERMHRASINVHRPLYTQMEFNEKYNFTAEESKSTIQKLCGLLHRQCTPSRPCIKKSLLSFFPFIGIMSQYSLRRDLLNDIIAGLTVGIMHIPQGLYFYVPGTVSSVYLYFHVCPLLYFFTTRAMLCAVYAMVVCPSVCLFVCVCLSVRHKSVFF